MSVRWRWEDPAAVAAVLDRLRHDAVVVLPTDTLYGFSGRARSARVVTQILALKAIGTARGFVALVDSPAAIREDAATDTDPRVFALLERIGPAPLSVIVRVREPQAWGEGQTGVGARTATSGTMAPSTGAAGSTVPQGAARPSAAYRIPAHPRLRKLLAALGEPVVSTSVNRTGQPPLAHAARILAEFGGGIAGCLEDPSCETGPRPASTLADCTAWPPVVLRPGAFDLAAALAALDTS